MFLFACYCKNEKENKKLSYFDVIMGYQHTAFQFKLVDFLVI